MYRKYRTLIRIGGTLNVTIAAIVTRVTIVRIADTYVGKWAINVPTVIKD